MPQGEIFPYQGRLLRDNGDGTVTDMGPATIGAPKQPDPTLPYQGDKARADAVRAAAEATMAGAQAPYAATVAAAEAEKARAEATRATAEADAAKSGEAQQTAEMREKALKGFADTQLLDKAIQEIKAKYAAGPGSTQGIWGVQDWMGGPANTGFDQAGNSIRALAKGVLGFTGQELNTPAETEQALGPYTPQAGDWDNNIESKIARLEALRDSGYERAVRSLGGVPDAQGNVTPLPPGEPPNAMTVNRLLGSQQLSAAAFNSTKQAVPIPPEMQAEHQAYLAQNLGNFDPAAYAEFRAGLDEKYGFPGGGRQSYLDWATGIKPQLENGGLTVNPNIPPTERQMAPDEISANNLVNNPIGATVAGVTNAGGFGVPEMLAPAQMAALREARPGAELSGEMLGAVGGTAAIAKAAREVSKNLAPKLLQGGKWAKRARDIGTDAVYGAAYGGTTQGDPIGGSVLATGGSVLGRGVGRGVGALTGGINISDAAKALRAKGVDLTGGRLLGKAASRAEDKAATFPFIGDMIQRRQGDAFQEFNQAGFNDVGGIVGFKPTAIGREGLGQLNQVKGTAYSDAVDNVAGPLDNQFALDMQAALSKAASLPKDRRKALGQILDARVNPINDAGVITGKQYQQAMIALKAARSDPPSKFKGYAQDYKDAVTGAMDALTAQIERIGGPEVTAKLAKANQLNKGIKILENASLDRAKVGSRSGQVEVFTPSQLLESARASEKKYGPMDSLLQLGQQGQEVLPSTVPNSGTADRLLMNGLGLGLLGGSAGADTAFDTNISPYAAAATALLTAGGTKKAQQLLTAGGVNRPEVLKKVGEALRKRNGLFGSAFAPLAINYVR